MGRREPITLISTLGGKPDIVTFALDYLLNIEKLTIDELILVHLSPLSKPNEPSRIHTSLQRVSGEFVNGRYHGHAIKLTPYAVAYKDDLLADIHNDAQANAVWQSINSLIYRLKNEYRTLHICVSGGRRMLALQTLSAAMIHFGHHDVLWHMYTPQQWKDKAVHEGLLHLPENSGFQLIRVPMVPWGTIFPGWRELAHQITSNDLIARKLLEFDAQDRNLCQQVYVQLTPRQQEILRAIVQTEDLQDTAVALNITLSTVNSHKTQILDQCRLAWELDPSSRLDYHFIIKKFEHFFD